MNAQVGCGKKPVLRNVPGGELTDARKTSRAAAVPGGVMGTWSRDSEELLQSQPLQMESSPPP